MYTIAMGSQPLRLLVIFLCILYHENKIVDLCACYVQYMEE